MKNEWKISQIAAGFGSAVTSVSLCLMHAGVHVNALPPGSVSSTAGAKRGARRGGSQPSPRPPPSGGLGLSSELTQQIKVQGGRWRSEAPSHPPPPPPAPAFLKGKCFSLPPKKCQWGREVGSYREPGTRVFPHSFGLNLNF